MFSYVNSKAPNKALIEFRSCEQPSSKSRAADGGKRNPLMNCSCIRNLDVYAHKLGRVGTQERADFDIFLITQNVPIILIFSIDRKVRPDKGKPLNFV